MSTATSSDSPPASSEWSDRARSDHNFAADWLEIDGESRGAFVRMRFVQLIEPEPIPMTEAEEARLRAIRLIAQNKWEAHRILFAHRHPTAPALFHPELVEDFWSDDQYSQVLAFRGGAKSTYGEEDIVLAACLQLFRNILIIGASQARAAERLAAVVHELKTNDVIAELFGQIIHGKDTQTKIETAFGCIQAMGRDQDIRGIKHIDWRPDLVFVDDFEDKDNVMTPDGRTKTLRWFLAELLPACVPHRRVRIRATPMDAESVPMRLANDAKWRTRTFPIETIDAAGRRVASWPSMFSLEWIDRERQTYARLGQLDVWSREYMCEAVSDASRTFTDDMIRVRPQIRTWEPVWAMYDPARTMGTTAATTGMAVWSWVKNRLVFWKSDGQRWRPDEIIADIFKTDADFDPVWIGVEKDGLAEWLMQPIRHEMTRRGVTIPILPVQAPRSTSKFDFIRALQPFFRAGEIEFACEQPEFRQQLLGFPRGAIDVPNAAAYALLLRPGLPIYENFHNGHVVEQLGVERHQRVYLAFNATRGLTTAVMLQYAAGRLRILADFVMEGDPPVTAPVIVRDASMLARAQPLCIVGPQHFDQWNNVGLAQALKLIPVEVENGTAPEPGRQAMRDEFERLYRGEPVLKVARTARYTLNALSGGYCRQMTRQGVLTSDAEVGVYRVLMEGLESCLGVTLASDAVDENANWAYTSSGTRYRKYSTGYDRRQP